MEDLIQIAVREKWVLINFTNFSRCSNFRSRTSGAIYIWGETVQSAGTSNFGEEWDCQSSSWSSNDTNSPTGEPITPLISSSLHNLLSKSNFWMHHRMKSISDWKVTFGWEWWVGPWIIFRMFKLKSWYDYRIAWNPSEFAGIKSINIAAYKLWKPDIVVLNK